MKRFWFLLLCLTIFNGLLMASNRSADFVKGTPEIKSIGSLAFGPDGIIFVGDSQGGAIFAVDTDDKMMNEKNEALQIEDIDEKIAALLGTSAKEVRIHDLAVNPISQNAYLSVSRGKGKDEIFVLLRVSPAGTITEFSLENVAYSQKDLKNPVAVDAKDRRGRSLRSHAITDLAYSDGKLFVAGLSNEEFSSTLRVMPFPFESEESTTSLEIFHAAHRRYETNAPIRTLLTYELKNEPHVLAAYTCTPLVSFPMTAVEKGGHVKGATVAELGSGNRPLDMLVFQQNEKDYILLANSNRTLMKIDPKKIETQEAITEPVTERYGTAGVEYIAIAQVGVQQIDNLNNDYVLVIQRMSNGSLDIRSLPKRRL